MGRGKPEFDIHQLHSFSLLDPETKLFVPPNQEDKMRQNLIYQFTKEDHLFEVYELLNPKELSLRIKVIDL